MELKDVLDSLYLSVFNQVRTVRKMALTNTNSYGTRFSYTANKINHKAR